MFEAKKFTERHASLHKPEKRTVTNEQQYIILSRVGVAHN